jgi:hypothetical protein
MRLKRPVCYTALVLILIGSIAWADQIVLKDGTVYSGKFVRGDGNTVDFRILGRIETFKVSNIVQIVFKEPELENSASVRNAAKTPVPPPSTEEPETQVSDNQSPPIQLRRPTQGSNPENPPGTSAGIASSADYGATPDSGITLPVGTPITIRTTTAIDTDRNRVGDFFDALLEQPLVWQKQTIFPRGTTIKGRIAYAKESGKLTGQSQLVLELTELMANGKSYLLRTSDYTETGANRANRSAATVGGTAALGAVIGAIAGGGKGAAVGAASGAAVGTGVQVMTRGQVLKIPAETVLEFRLQSPLKID